MSFQRILSGLLLCALLLEPVYAGKQAGGLTFSVSGTRFQGQLSEDGRVRSWLGVPFAQPPVGKLRWREPLPIQEGPADYPADSFAPACAQGRHMVAWYQGVIESFGGDPDRFPVPEFSEDCLYLNVWAPATSSEPQPVMVYIHGGSNKGGWSYEPNYIGEQLARRGVVLVTLPYRVGIFGFFSHPGLPQSNFGLLDQVAGLEWVRRHVHQIGGDPGRVTVFGESSGANNIAHLIVSPASQGLFQRVIHQSAGWAVQGSVKREDLLDAGETLSVNAGGTAGDIKVLRELDAERLIALVGQHLPDHEYDPVVDGHSLPAPVPDLLAAGKFAPVDLIIGSNADEWLMYLADDASLAQWKSTNLTPEQVAALEDILDKNEDPMRTLDKLETARSFVCPSLELARAIAARGGNSWVYYFSRQRPGEQAAAMGAYHGAELPYVFDTHDDWLPTGPEDRKLTALMMEHWTSFARDGTPSGNAGTAPWPAFAPGRQQVLELNVPAKVLNAHPSQAICAAMAVKH